MKCVYKIENIITGQIYIGSTINFRKRKNNHLCRLRIGKHFNKKLQNDFTKYGEIFFSFNILEECNNLIEREQYHLNEKLPYYNVKEIAYAVYGENHPMFGRSHSEQSKSKIKEARSKQVIKHSQETKNKIGAKHIGRPISNEQKEKLRVVNIGRTPWNKGLKTQSPVNKIVLCRNDLSVLLSMYNAGSSIECIRKLFNISWDTVKLMLIENGIKTRNISQQKLAYNASHN